MFKSQVSTHHINPRFRAYGKARIDIAKRVRDQGDWYKLWKEPTNPFPFAWGENWRQCVEYKVDDFAAEVGFFIDILGLPVNAFDPDYAMFTSPRRDFFLSIVPTFEDEYSTPPDAIRIQFMVDDIFSTVEELERRGVEFEQQPQACQEGSSLYIGYFRTPHGICVDLWGFVDQEDDGDEFYVDHDDTLQDFEDDVDTVTSSGVDEGSGGRISAGNQREDEIQESESEADDTQDEGEDLEDSEGKFGDEGGEDDFEENIRYVYDEDEEEAENRIWKVRYS
jgi:catechol 2,3-dioxygenase-like lactoylglutathione lyase family enzyme